MHAWIPFTLLAATMQSVRTAGQKALARRASPLAATWTRYAYGLPFSLVYLAAVWLGRGAPAVAPGATFWVYAALASVAQVVATLLLVQVLTLRNFAAATTYAKTETVLTAVLGTLFFGSMLTAAAWLSVLLGVAGTLLVSMTTLQLSLRESLNRSLLLGVGAGLCFALTSWWLRTASRSLNSDFLVSAAFTLAAMGVIQTAMTTAWMALADRGAFRRAARQRGLCLFVGATSVAGSVGWFTAMTLQDAAYVKALGQIEFVLAVGLTHYLFRERIALPEWIGITMVVLAVLALLLGL